MSSFFKKTEPISKTISIDENTVIADVVSALNKTAEARYDGENAKYVNNLQPEVDFTQDQRLVQVYLEEGLANIAKRIEPYMDGYYTYDDTDSTNPKYVFSLLFPAEWRTNQENVLQVKMHLYLVHFVMARWFERVSVDDIDYTDMKADRLLRDIKRVCELRNSKLHKGWNTTY